MKYYQGTLDPLSTDNTGGYQCWMDDATIAYLRMVGSFAATFVMIHFRTLS